MASTDRWRALAVLLVCVVVLAMLAPGADYFLSSTDHGFQLALGSQVLVGKIPGLDVYNAYGPLAIYPSALGQLVAGPFLGESLLCILGYAAALTGIYVALARSAGDAWGLAGTAFGLLALSRFYKWYFWLASILVLLAFQSWLGARDRVRGSSWMGLALGTAWLFRPDLGFTFGLGVGAVACALELRRGAESRLGSVLARMAAGACLPIAAWLGLLLVLRGPGAPLFFLRSTLLGALTVKTGMGTDWPEFHASLLLSSGTVRVVAGAALVLTYASAVVIGGRAELRGRTADQAANPRTRLLLAAGVIGFASLHQALHRKGIHHLFQVIAPWIVAAFVLTDLLVRSLLRGSGSRGTLAAVALAWLVLATWTGAGLVKYGRVDLEPFDAWPMTRFASLANPLQGRAPGPLVTPIKRLRQLTRPDDSILIYPLDPQLYAPAERRMSGMLHAYYPGVYSDPPWSTHNLAAIQADPPAVILVPSGFGAVPDPESGFGEHRTSHAYLDEFLRSNYTRVLFDDGLRMLLGPTTGRRRQGRRRHSRRGYAGRALRARRSIRRGSPATPFRCGHAGAIRTGVGTRARTSGEVAQYSCATFSP